MLQAKSKTFSSSQLSVPEATARIWRALQHADGHLPDLDQFGAGEVVGGHLRVRFVRDEAGKVFACEVADTLQDRVWEAGFAQTADAEWRTFWRDFASSPTEPEEWRAATGDLSLTPHTPRFDPTFLAIFAAHAATGGIVLGDNVMTRAAVDDDLAYWRDLARTQASLIGRLTAKTTWSAGDHQVDSAPAASGTERAWRLQELGEWAAINSDRIVILPRAISAARKAIYQDHSTVFAALNVLAGSYRDVKAGRAPRDKARDDLELLGITMGGSVDPANAGDEYFVRWSGRRRFLDQHLKKGTSRDPRFALRIYYTWDEELGVCVVGWLPSHLSNSMS